MNKKVMIYAYTKYNLGDDLLIQILCKRYPHAQFLLYTYPEYQSVFSDCSNLKIVSNGSIVSKAINSIGRLLHKKNAYERNIAKKCDVCVCITGSLFIQGEGDWRPYLAYMKSRQVPRVPFYQIDSNFGPYRDKGFYEGFKEYFCCCEDVCFREQYSYDLFADLPNVRVAPDVVFSGQFPVRKSEKMISISVINLRDRKDLAQYQTHYRDYMVDLCRYYCQKGYRVNLMSFCKEEGDEIMVGEILHELEEEEQGISPVFYRGNIDEIVNLISQSEVVVATRFHAMILGWCMGKKVLPIIYSEKTEHVLYDIQYTGKRIKIQQMNRKVINMEHEITKIEILKEFDKYKIKQDAEKQFEKLDKALNYRCNN